MLLKNPSHIYQLAYLIVAFGVSFVVSALSQIRACDTPVYRYAMYRWQPAPYEIYYFHEDAIAAEAAQLNQRIEAAAASEQTPANLMILPVSLKDDPELKRVPPDVKKAWLAQEKPVAPAYMVVTPYGVPLHVGALDEATVTSLIDSPARADIGKQLEAGKACVLLLMTTSDAAANAEAEKAATTLIQDVQEGKVELYSAPAMFGDPAAGDEEKPKVEIGFLKIDRHDAKEKWLVESLLSMEPDLKDPKHSDKPKVFGIFGRGRALPPFVGPGITRDNLLQCVDFVTGACSCTVKDQNPGMDLLIAKDWDAAAETLANSFGTEEGAEHHLGAADMFPDLIIPGEQPKEAPKESPAASAVPAAVEEKTAPQEPEQPPPPSSQPEQPQQPATTVSEIPKPALASADPQPPASVPPAVAAPAKPTAVAASPPAPAVATAAPVGHATPSQPSGADGTAFVGVFAVGAGICVALALLFGLTFFVLRPK
jgi:hypothetical protein